MNAFEDLKLKPLDVLQAYHHFIYYIDVADIREKDIWGKSMTNHFLDKLVMYTKTTGAEYMRPDVVVTWVQNMTPMYQDMLLQYIMKFHSNKW